MHTLDMVLVHTYNTLKNRKSINGNEFVICVGEELLPEKTHPRGGRREQKVNLFENGI